MICEECRTELEPVSTICPGCGARVGSRARRGEPEWREQVRERVLRHKQKRRVEQEKRDGDARQLSIFPEASPEDEGDREARERRAEIRARVEERVLKRRPTPSSERLFDDPVAPPSGGRSAAARKLDVDPEPEPDPETEADAHDPAAAELELHEDPSELGGEREIDRMPPFEPDVSTEPEEAPFTGLGIASAGERILGGLIDLAFVGLIQLTLFYLTTHLVAQQFGNLPRSAIVAMAVVGAVLAAGYFLFFWGLSGQTLGKLLTGTRVVDRRGGALGFGRAGVRLLGALVAVAPLFAGFLGLWTHPERRGWHDRIAGTKVVRG